MKSHADYVAKALPLTKDVVRPVPGNDPETVTVAGPGKRICDQVRHIGLQGRTLGEKQKEKEGWLAVREELIKV